jgi:hypothetical protein
MRRKLYITLLTSLICLNINAQGKEIKFHSINSIGLAVGEHGSAMILQSVNGVVYKRFYSGIGFGLDYYNYNSYPLFFDQRVFLGKSGDVFFYGDIGYNLSTSNNKPGNEVYYNKYHFSGGVYTDIGIGYRVKLKRGSFMTFSSGFSYKEINNKVAVIYPCFSSEACPVDYSNYRYGNGRVVLKAGIDF